MTTTRQEVLYTEPNPKNPHYHLTTEQRAKGIRADLAKLGYNNRKVSVRQSGYSAIYVQLKVEVTDEEFKKIESTAQQYEHIYYDNLNCEILQGGNTFIFVQKK